LKSEAIIFRKAGDVAIEEIDLPDLGPADVLVDVEYSSISTGTERWCLAGQIQMGPGKFIRFPFIPGYQAAGTVREAGDGVQGIRPGDRVFSSGTRLTDEWVGSWGGHVRHHVASAGSVIKLPDSVSTKAASGLLLAQVGYNGASRPRVERGDTAIVVGDGLVGQYAGQVLRHRGARVILAGHHDSRLRLAAEYAADQVVNSHQQDFFSSLREEYPKGVPIAVETASKSDLVRQATEALQYGGQLVVLGYYPEGECLIDIHWVRHQETTVYFPNSSTPERLRATLDLLEGKDMRVEELVTHEFSYGEAQEAYRMIVDKSSDFLGLVFRWNVG
jgi:2-desacetyl-2-hydroxyethyl bacteriochlorophyllide A dehydrogenase